MILIIPPSRDLASVNAHWLKEQLAIGRMKCDTDWAKFSEWKRIWYEWQIHKNEWSVNENDSNGQRFIVWRRILRLAIGDFFLTFGVHASCFWRIQLSTTIIISSYCYTVRNDSHSLLFIDLHCTYISPEVLLPIC